jgi:hypothetical protein
MDLIEQLAQGETGDSSLSTSCTCQVDDRAASGTPDTTGSYPLSRQCPDPRLCFTKDREKTVSYLPNTLRMSCMDDKVSFHRSFTLAKEAHLPHGLPY